MRSRSENSPALPAGTAKSSGWLPEWFPWLVLGALWFFLIRQLWLEWSTNEDYSYGFVVPLLALYLFGKRWSCRPEPKNPALDSAALGVLLAIPALFLLPIRLIQESNPEWRFVSWFMAGVVVALTLGLVYCRGGRSWAAHFAFPIAFIFTAVPWPTLIEGPLTRLLMQLDTSCVVFLLNWLGIPALQNGNVIEAAGGMVGISEACSGIRSLQITFMFSLFFGELYRFPAFRRLILLFLVAVVALICNLGRTFLLAWLSVHYGNSVMEKWHDTAGFGVLALALAAFWGVAAWMNRHHSAPPEMPGSHNPGMPRPWPARFVVALAAWLFVVQTATEAWYRIHESDQTASAAAWSVNWPESRPGFRQIKIPERSRSMLKYSTGRQASWSDGNGLTWSVFFFQWAPGRTSAILARGHNPEICLPAIGCKLVRSGETRVMDVHGYSIPFHFYVFEQGLNPIHVWWCLWEGGDLANPKNDFAANRDSSPYRGILGTILNGRRNAGQQVLEIALSGGASDEEANAALARLLPELIAGNHAESK